MKYDFYSDEKELLQCWLDKIVFNNKLKLGPNEIIPYDIVAEPNEILPIELIVRPECNQHCKYCYITQHGKNLYPIEERASNEVILKNLDSFLFYVFKEKKVFINHWELFAGDMFYDGLFFDICKTFYKYIEPLYNTYRHLFNNPFLIILPCNCAFVQDDEKVQLYDEWVDKFEKIGTRIIISYSGDGKYAIDAREQTNKIDDAYYDKLFKFLIKHDYLCHPMVAPENIDNAIKNYDWWVEQCQKYYVPNNPKDILPMFLEVRNDYWTEDKIEKYRQLLDHMIQDRLRMCNNSVDDLAWHLFNGDGSHNTLPSFEQNDLIRFVYIRDNEEENNWLTFRSMSCSFQALVHITLNNLSIVPCHRTTYSQFIAGKFEQDENGKIIGVIPHNVSFFLTSKYAQPNFYPKCVHCILKRICQKGCLGAQFETNAEIYQPAISVCEMLKTKYMFTAYKLVEMGVIESAKTQDILPKDVYDYYNMLHDEWLALDVERKRGCHYCE